MSADSEEQLHRKLIESLVGVATVTKSGEVEVLILDTSRGIGREPDAIANGRAALAQRAKQTLDFLVGVEACDLVLEDEVGAHASACEVPHTGLVFGSIRVTVEVSHARPARVLEQLDEEERPLGVLAAEPEVLVEAAGLLRVQVDVK